MRILIPKLSLNKYELEKKENDYILKLENKEIHENDTINLKLTEIRFEKEGFSCLGTL